MVIVVGSVVVDAADREQYLADAQAHAAASRGDTGCRSFTVAADSSDPSRVVYLELWDSAADLASHAAASRARDLPTTGVARVSSDFAVYEAAEPVPLA